MTSEDRKIEEFFQQMREQDSQLTIPSIPEQGAFRKTRRWIPLAVAASFALLLTVYFMYPSDEKEDNYTIEIVLTEQSDIATQSLGECRMSSKQNYTQRILY